MAMRATKCPGCLGYVRPLPAVVEAAFRPAKAPAKVIRACAHAWGCINVSVGYKYVRAGG
eukprot:6174014-Pleurochrysis_carterae.AAC.2